MSQSTLRDHERVDLLVRAGFTPHKFKWPFGFSIAFLLSIPSSSLGEQLTVAELFPCCRPGIATAFNVLPDVNFGSRQTREQCEVIFLRFAERSPLRETRKDTFRIVRNEEDIVNGFLLGFNAELSTWMLISFFSIFSNIFLLSLVNFPLRRIHRDSYS